MKRKIVIILTIVLIFIGLYKEVHAEDNIFIYDSDEVVLESKKDFQSDLIFDSNETKREDLFVIYNMYDVSEYKMASISVKISSTIEYSIVLANAYYDHFIPVNIMENKTIDFTNIYEGLLDTNDYSYLYITRKQDVGLDYGFTFKSSIHYDNINICAYKEQVYVKRIGEKYAPFNYPLYFNDYEKYISVISLNTYSVDINKDTYLRTKRLRDTNIVVSILSNGKTYVYNYGVTVIDDEGPIITSDSDRLVFDMKDGITEEAILSHFKAFDKIDGDVSSRLELLTRKIDMLPVGQHEIVIHAADWCNQASSIYANISIIDTREHKMSYSIDLSYSLDESVEGVIKRLGVYDNYLINVLDENYSYNSNVCGECYIHFEAIGSLYTDDCMLQINVIDDVSPVVIIDDIKTTVGSQITKEKIIENTTVYDFSKYKIDVDLSNYIYDKKGEYSIRVVVTDSFDNITEKEVSISVISDNQIYYYNQRIETTTSKVLSEDQTIDLLRDVSPYNYNSAAVSRVESNYFKTPQTEGEYAISLITELESGNEIREEYFIKVIDENKKEIEEEGAKPKPKKKKNKILRMFAYIRELLKKLFKFLF